MIVDINEGEDLTGAWNYVFGQGNDEDGNRKTLQPGEQSRAVIVGQQNMDGLEPDVMLKIMEHNAKLQFGKRKSEKDVVHISLSLAPGQTLNKKQWLRAAKSLLNRLGMEDGYAIIVAHNDTKGRENKEDREHIHIIGSNIKPKSPNGTAYNNYNRRYRGWHWSLDFEAGNIKGFAKDIPKSREKDHEIAALAKGKVQAKELIKRLLKGKAVITTNELNRALALGGHIDDLKRTRGNLIKDTGLIRLKKTPQGRIEGYTTKEALEKERNALERSISRLADEIKNITGSDIDRKILDKFAKETAARTYIIDERDKEKVNTKPKEKEMPNEKNAPQERETKWDKEFRERENERRAERRFQDGIDEAMNQQESRPMPRWRDDDKQQIPMPIIKPREEVPIKYKKLDLQQEKLDRIRAENFEREDAKIDPQAEEARIKNWKIQRERREQEEHPIKSVINKLTGKEKRDEAPPWKREEQRSAAQREKELKEAEKAVEKSQQAQPQQIPMPISRDPVPATNRQEQPIYRNPGPHIPIIPSQERKEERKEKDMRNIDRDYRQQSKSIKERDIETLRKYGYDDETLKGMDDKLKQHAASQSRRWWPDGPPKGKNQQHDHHIRAEKEQPRIGEKTEDYYKRRGKDSIKEFPIPKRPWSEKINDVANKIKDIPIPGSGIIKSAARKIESATDNIENKIRENFNKRVRDPIHDKTAPIIDPIKDILKQSPQQQQREERRREKQAKSEPQPIKQAPWKNIADKLDKLDPPLPHQARGDLNASYGKERIEPTIPRPLPNKSKSKDNDMERER